MLLSHRFQVKKAFRKHALTCHPDKNPDNPKAAELFQKYSKATEILLDPSARKAYERVLKARKDRAVRNRTLDSKRKKLKDDLEARERAAKDEVESEVDAVQKLAEEIERLRKEGSKELERQNEELRRQFESELLVEPSTGRRAENTTTSQSENTTSSNYDLSNDNVHRLKAKWKKQTFDEASLRRLFSRHGHISGLVVSRKGTSAIIEFRTRAEALNALNGSADNISIELMETNANDARAPPTTQPTINVPTSAASQNRSAGKPLFSAPAAATFAAHSLMRKSAEDDTDLAQVENNVLLKLKRAQERKRLLEAAAAANQSEAETPTS